MFLVMVSMTSCTQVSHEDWQKQYDRECAGKIHKFNYEGHSYLLYRSGTYGTGITHDENCSCRNKND